MIAVVALKGKRDPDNILATIVNDWADDFAWVSDDIENAVRAGLLTEEELVGLPLLNQAKSEIAETIDKVNEPHRYWDAVTNRLTNY